MALIQFDKNGVPLTPKELRKRGLRRAVSAQVALSAGDRERGAKEGKLALANLVDAFLHDREENADLFARAHRLGEMLSEAACCTWTHEEDQYTLRCPIFALHRPFAHSVSMTVTTECSICGATALACDHIHGETYDGVLCASVVTKIASLGHVAFTADPDFVYTWHQPQQVKTSDLLADGTISWAGQPAYCSHCQECARGRLGPSADDLDPVATFDRLKEKNLPRDALREEPGSGQS